MFLENYFLLVKEFKIENVGWRILWMWFLEYYKVK